jgi:preprotein translocase subunit YajC
MKFLLALIIAALIASPAADAQTAGSQWTDIHGKVAKIEGTTLTLKADDGRTLAVDMTQVGENIRKALTPGEGVIIRGFAGAQPNQFTARFIQQDSSDPSRGGRIVGQAAPQQWQTVHGTVDEVKEKTLVLRADDGRPITVDMAQVGEDIRKALTKGEGVTVTGFWEGDQSRLSARSIQQDSSDPARGGRVVPPAASPATGPRK